MASFLARFAAFRSFGVIVGCFLPSLFGLRSLLMLFAPYPYYFTAIIRRNGESVNVRFES